MPIDILERSKKSFSFAMSCCFFQKKILLWVLKTIGWFRKQYRSWTIPSIELKTPFDHHDNIQAVADGSTWIVCFNKNIQAPFELAYRYIHDNNNEKWNHVWITDISRPISLYQKPGSTLKHVHLTLFDSHQKSYLYDLTQSFEGYADLFSKWSHLKNQNTEQLHHEILKKALKEIRVIVKDVREVKWVYDCGNGLVTMPFRIVGH